MAGKDENKKGKVTLDIELKDLVDMVSRSKAPPVSGATQHSVEGEELKKAWFKHVLISMEKLSDAVQDIRNNDLKELRSELRAEFSKELDRVTKRATKSEDALELYKKEVIKPLNDKITALLAKLGVWSVLAGFIGSGLMGLIIWLLKEYLFKP